MTSFCGLVGIRRIHLTLGLIARWPFTESEEAMRKVCMIACLAMISALLGAPNMGFAQTIKIGSKNFTESILVANMMADVIEAAGLKVERKIGLGGTGVVHQALVSGEIDAYPEYTGTALLVQLKMPVNNDPDVVYKTVKAEYESRFDSTWLAPLGFNDTYALAMRMPDAEKLGLKTISDLAKKSSELTIGSTQEFLVRPDALPGLETTYGLKFKASRGMDPGLVYQAIASGEVDVISVFTTDARIKANNLAVLADDKRFFPPYYLCPVVRQQALKSAPALASALGKLAGRFTEREIIDLNAAIDIDKKPAAEVAKAALKAKGIIP